jgi:hypothetical protein
VTVVITDPHDVSADPAMPFITLALDPAYLQPRLQSLAAPGGEELELRAIRVTRWKPGRRCLIEYDLAGRDVKTGARTLIGKVRAKSFDASTCALAKQLAEYGLEPDSADGVSVPAVLGALDECHMWLQQKVSGIPGWQALTAPNGLQVARRIGGAIAKLHRVLPPLPRKHSIADEIAGLHRALDEIRRLRPEWDRRLWAVERACELLAATVTQTCVSGVHRDFYHDQVIVDGDRIWLLDLDLAAEGDPAVDAGNFTAHLAEQSLRMQGNPDALAAEEAAFVSAFWRAGGDAHRENIEIYKTLSLARHIYISATVESRRQYTNALLTLCEDRLGL